ncbi:MAG: hypothetical protein OJF48_000114 [Afipia sp.]|nr:MAG: hypothetical protein OJF48_000114 [Afipia sp.]
MGKFHARRRQDAGNKMNGGGTKSAQAGAEVSRKFFAGA